jgi:lipid-binding SYLF domain-containing protein
MRFDSDLNRYRKQFRFKNSPQAFSKEEKMAKFIRSLAVKIIIVIFAMAILTPCTAIAASKAEIDQNVDFALQKLYDSSPSAKLLSEKAKGILVFPSIVKAGFIFGGQLGDGALLIKNKTAGYYRTVSFSYGLQAGVQSFGYALFFMTQPAMNYLWKSGGWEIGVGPSIVIVDKGVAKSLTTTTAKDDIYAFFFDQKGLMAGLGLQGTKIMKINPK